MPLASGEVDPFAVPGEERSPSEADARVVTKEGRRTLEILRTEKIDSVELVTGKFEEGFEIVKDRLAKHGIEVRIMKGRKLDADDPLYIKFVQLQSTLQFMMSNTLKMNLLKFMPSSSEMAAR